MEWSTIIVARIAFGLVIALCIVALVMRAARAKGGSQPRSKTEEQSPPLPTGSTVRAPRPSPAPATTRTLEVRVKRDGFWGRFFLWIFVILGSVSIVLWIVQQPIFGSLNPWGWVWIRPQDNTPREHGVPPQPVRPQDVVVELSLSPVSEMERARVEAERFPPVFAPPGEWSRWIRIPDHFTIMLTPGPASNLYRRQCSSSYEMPHGVGDQPLQEVPCMASNAGAGGARWIRVKGTDPYGVDITYRFVLT